MAPKPKIVHHKLRPEEPFEAIYNLSLADNIPPTINSRFLFIYSTEHEEGSMVNSRQSLVDRLMKGLESFLQQPTEGMLALPQLVGKIHQEPSNGRYAIKITKQSGIPFVVATHDEIAFEDLRPDQGFPSRAFDHRKFSTGIDQMTKPDRSGGAQAFQAQVTFVQGGFVVCVAKHHALIDDIACGYLVRWWFERSRHFATSDMPAELKVERDAEAMAIHDQSALIEFKEVPQQDHSEWEVVESTNASVLGTVRATPGAINAAKNLFSKTPAVGRAAFYFAPSSLRQLLQDLKSQGSQEICVEDALFALLWRCVTRARLSTAQQAESDKENQPKTSLLTVAIDGRERLEPKMSQSYFGNATFYAPTTCTVDLLTDVGSASLSNVVVAIRESNRTTTTNEHLRSLLQLMAAQAKASTVVNSFKLSDGLDLTVMDWEKTFGQLQDLDLAYGEFQTMRIPSDGMFNGLARIMPSFGERETFGLELALDLTTLHLDALKADMEWIKYAENLEW